MAKDDPDVWFEPKRFGYGAGLPVSWRGWMLLIGYLVVLIAASALLRLETRAGYVAYVVVIVAATVALMAMAAQHTRGGWRWRSGREE